MKQIVIVLINYFKEGELKSFVSEFLMNQSYADLHIVIVDNGSYHVDILHSLDTHAQLSLLFPGRNLGYFGAADFAFNHWKEKSGKIPDIFIVSNFDLSFDQSHFFSHVDNACKQTSASVLGPFLRSSLSNSDLNPMYTSRLSIHHVNRIIRVTSFYPLYLVYQGLHYLRHEMTNSTTQTSMKSLSTYAIHGSFMIFKKDYFERGGTLNYGSFLYGEEIFVAEQCRQLGLVIEVNPNLIVVHHEHTTTGKIKNRQHMRWLNDSMRYLRDRFF